jgi:hypothetical protein
LAVGAGAPRPELFIYDWQGGSLEDEGRQTLPRLYRDLWNYGRVPLALVLGRSVVDVYNLLSAPTFDSKGLPKAPERIDSLVLTPMHTLATAGAAARGIDVSKKAWERFSARQFDTGAFWEAKENQALASGASSLDSLVREMRDVRQLLETQTVLSVERDQKNWFVRRLLIITLMVRFLEDRGILPVGYFKDEEFLGADDFKTLLRHPRALLRAIGRLESDFNGDVFHVDPVLREILSRADERTLSPIANFAAGNMQGEQQFFWERYSFKALPVEVISYVYEDFLEGKSQAYFTPHHLVDLLLDEVMPEKKVLAALQRCDPRRSSSEAAFPILDPACGSGVFLVGAWRRLLDAFSIIDEVPPPEILKKLMVDNLFGIDIENESVELTIFSLCVALCSAFPRKMGEPSYVFDQLRRLKFPTLRRKNIVRGDFFAQRESMFADHRRFRLVVGNPPFESKLESVCQNELDRKPTDEDAKKWPQVPDKQISYLFLRGIMPLLLEGGDACLIQPAGLIYNEKTEDFRKCILANWKVPQILDFASIAGLFTTRKKSSAGAGSKVGVKTVAVFVRREAPNADALLLHATFRRTALLNNRRVFEIDPQDLHWTPLNIASHEPRVWKANLLGGGRLLETYQSINKENSLGAYIARMRRERNWVCSEGFIEADIQSYKPNATAESKRRYTPQRKPERLTWSVLDTEALGENGIDAKGISKCGVEWYLWPRDDKLFSPPHILIKEHESLPLAIREQGKVLLFRHEIIGIAAPREDVPQLRAIYAFLQGARDHIPFFAAFGPRYLVGRQTALLKNDIMNLPFPKDGKLVFRGIQKYLKEDVIDYMIPLIKDTAVGRRKLGQSALEKEVESYAKVFVKLMQSVYKEFHLSGIHDLGTGWCAAFHKGNDSADVFENSEVLRKYIDDLLSRETGRALRSWRIVRHFSGKDLYIIKPKPIRYWLKSAAVSDADQAFAWVMHRAKRKAKLASTTAAEATPS